MGYEIVYCDRCSHRVAGPDFAKGALRAGLRVYCARCAEAEGISAGPATVRVPPRTPPPMVPDGVSKEPRTLPWAAAGLALLVLLGLASMLLLTGVLERSAEWRPEPPSLAPAPAASPPAREALSETPAGRALAEARAYSRDHPDDVDGSLERFRGAAWSFDGTPEGEAARKEAQALRDQRARRLEAELTQLDAEIDRHLREGSPARAEAALTEARRRRSSAGWILALDQRLRQLETRIRPSVSRRPDPGPSADEAGRATLEAAWKPTLERAAARLYDEAEEVLRSAAASLKTASLRSEAEQELQLLEQADDLVRRGLLNASRLPRGRLVALDAWDGRARRARISGRIWAAYPEALEIKPDGAVSPKVVDLLDVAAASLAALAAPRTPEERRAAAAVCLFEGDAGAARSWAPDPASIPEKYWCWAAAAALPPRERRTVEARNERSARRLLIGADGDFRLLPSRPAAVRAYRKLLDTYPDSAAVARGRERIERRARGCREYRFTPEQLTATGTFRRSGWKSRRAEIPDCWTSEKDIDWTLSRDNYVEFRFAALERTRYRCWVYAGGCCMESFTFHFQTSDYQAVHPDTKKTVAAVPGGNFAFPLEPRGFFRAEHRAHARGPKRPERWQWIEVPLGSYLEEGVKSVRLLTDQQGFSVAYAVVSADRSAAPDAEETRTWAAPVPFPAAVPEPREFLLLGPFVNVGLDAPFEPEERIRLGVQAATAAGLREWTPEFSELRGPAAVFDFAARFAPSEKVVAYALLHVRSDQVRELRLRLGSDDGVKVWHDGALVHRVDRSRGVTIDEDCLPLKLRAGWNRLLFKVAQGTGGWGLAVRLAEADGTPAAGLQYDAYGNLPEAAPDLVEPEAAAR